jgi:hypothetical protein
LNGAGFELMQERERVGLIGEQVQMGARIARRLYLTRSMAI